MDDNDDGDEVADFSTLLNKSKKRGGGGGAPKRGSKAFAPDNSSTQQQLLDQSRDALFEIIGEKKSLPSQHSVGILNNDDNSDHAWTTTLQQARGTYYQTMGHSIQGNMTLYLEEAAWLMNRHVLSCTSTTQSGLLCDTSTTTSGGDLDGATTTTPTRTTTTTMTPTTVVTFEDYCSFMFASMDGWITYERYQVYAYLKRLGYIVQRSSITAVFSSNKPNSSLSCGNNAKRSWIFRLGRLAHHICHKMIGLIRAFTWSLGSLSTRPLVTHYQCSNYNSVYSALRTIKFDPWHTPTLTMADQQQHQQTNDHLSVAWDVYKPNPKWKKRDPGVPDFRVVVGRMNDPFPSPDTLNHLFSLLYGLPYKDNAYYGIRNTRSKQSQPAFLMALVGNAEGVTFIRLQSDGVADIVPL